MQVIGPVLFKETSSNHYVKLISTPLFTEVTQEDKMWGNSFQLEELEGNF
jgi:hypothetical protein